MKPPVEQKLLMRTPAQHADESTWGYMLRLSSSNGYDRTVHLFEYAGMTRTEYSGVKIDGAKLKPLLGANGESLRTYVSPTNGTVSLLRGGAVESFDIVRGCTKACVACIEAHGYMPAWTDLRMIDVCPFHRCWLLTRCETCNRSLDWNRPSLLTCRCGAKLNHAASEEATDEHCRLARSFVRLINGETLDSQCVSLSAFPEITLERLLGLSKAVASLHFAATRDSLLSECQRAARMFAIWPASLSQAVDILVAGSTEAIEHGGTQLGKVAYTANKQLLRVSDIRDVSILRKQLAACVPGDVSSAKKSLQVEPRSNVERKVSGRPCKKNHEKIPVPGILRVRRAAERLGLPVRALRSLRQSGHFETLHPARWSAAYSVEDVVRFEKRVADLPLSPRASDQSIALRNLLTKQVRGDGKARIFAAVLDRSLAATGRTGPLLTDLEVDAKTAKALWNSIRQVANGGTINCVEAAESLGCHFHDVGALRRRGFIRGYTHGKHLRIYVDAPEAFRQEYALIKEIARAVGTSASRALAVASSIGLELFRDDVWPDRLVVIRRTDAAALHARLQR